MEGLHAATITDGVQAQVSCSLHAAANGCRGEHPRAATRHDDHRVRHGLTPVRVQRCEAPAYRDVPVLTYRKGGIPWQQVNTWRAEPRAVAPQAR